MVMGDRIKTRQQLLDQEARAIGSGTTSGDDRHDENARPHQVPDHTVSDAAAERHDAR